MARVRLWPLVISLTFALAPGIGLAKRDRRTAEPHTDKPAKPAHLGLQSPSFVLVDLDAGEEIEARNPDEVRPIASVGKLFLALVVRELGLPLDGQTTITDVDKQLASGGARSRLVVGKTFTNHDLLRAMLIASDNRACSALGRGAGLGPDALVAAMNDKAKKLGLVHTRFVDPTGLKGNVSTPREVAIALRAALADPVLAEILATPKAIVRSTDAKGPVTIEYSSTDLALRERRPRYEVLGGKTGYTDGARYCLAIAAKIDGRRVGMVFLGADGKMTRFGDFHRAAEWLLAGGAKQPPGEPHGPVGRALELPAPLLSSP